MKRWSTFDALTLAVLGLAAAVTAGVFERLPRRLAVHFDAHGVANGFMPRAAGAWLPLGIAFSVWLVLRVGPSFFPARLRERMNESPVAVAAFLLTLGLVGVHLLPLTDWYISR